MPQAPSPQDFPCPICGENVPAKAKACPHCGACDKTGWDEEANEYDGLDLPEEKFDYEKFKEEEFGEPREHRGRRLLWWWVTVILLVIFFLLTLANVFLRG